jgi:copper(I)-binding protein
MLRNVLLSLFMLVSGHAWAGPNDVMVDKVFVGESVPGQTSATLHLNMTTAKPAILRSVSSPLAARVEIHRMVLHKGKMVVREVASLALPRHRTTAFGSHQLFLMMVGLKKELNEGEQVPVSIVLEYANKRTQTINVNATVKKMDLSYKHYQENEVHDHR